MRPKFCNSREQVNSTFISEAYFIKAIFSVIVHFGTLGVFLALSVMLILGFLY